MTATRRRFLAGAAALVVAPSLPAPAVRFAAGPTLATGTVQVLLNGEALPLRGSYDPAQVAVELDGVRLRGPADGALCIWTNTEPRPRPEHLRRHPRG